MESSSHAKQVTSVFCLLLIPELTKTDYPFSPDSKMAIGECHIAKVVDLFIKLHEKAIAEKGLINNLVLHLCNLHSFGLVKARDVEKWIVQVRRIAARKAENAKNDKNGKIKNNSADESNQATVNGNDSSRVNDENSSVPSHENVVVNGLRR